MTLIYDIKHQLDCISDWLTELSQEYEEGGKNWEEIMYAVGRIQDARDILDDVGVPE